MLFSVGAVLAAAVAVFAVASGGSTIMFILFGGLAALAVIVLGLSKPHFAPFIIVAAAVYDKRIYFNYEQLQLSLLVVVLALTAPAFFASWARSKTLPKFLAVGSLLFCLGLVVACLASPNGAAAIIGTTRWLLVMNMILGTVVMIRSRPWLPRRLAWWLVSGAAVSSVLAMAQRSGLYVLVGPPYAKGVFNSTFEYYSNYANFVAMAAVVGVGLYLHIHRSRGRGRFPLGILIGICVYGTVASLSRGALIAMGAGFAVIVLRQVTKPGRFLASLTGIAALAGLVWLVISEEFKDDLIGRFIVSPRGDLVRRQMQQGGLEILGDTPLGIGFNNFKDFVSSGSVYGQQALSHTHNTYIQTGLDSGWAGLVGFLILVGGSAIAGLRSKGSMVRLGATAALIGCLGQVTQDYFFFEPASMVLFGVVLALAVASTDASAIPEPTAGVASKTVTAPKAARG